MPSSGPSRDKSDLFRERLDALLNMRHPLVRLSGFMPWARFDEAFDRFYRPVGRPAKPTRLMVALHYLKHVYDVSDEEVVERWVENAYGHYFSGFEFFQHEAPIDASTMTRRRKRIGPEPGEAVWCRAQAATPGWPRLRRYAPAAMLTPGSFAGCGAN